MSEIIPSPNIWESPDVYEVENRGVDRSHVIESAMREVLDRRPVIAETARRFAPTKRYWAVVGSGTNKVAAEEVRARGLSPCRLCDPAPELAA